jgi:uncharacterized repeat protein (TIGR03803 family)
MRTRDGVGMSMSPAEGRATARPFTRTRPYITQGLLLSSDGNFYGTTPSYGADNGTVFRITPTGTLTTIYRFSGLPTRAIRWRR